VRLHVSGVFVSVLRCCCTEGGERTLGKLVDVLPHFFFCKWIIMFVIEILRIWMRGFGWWEGRKERGRGEASVGGRKLGRRGVGRLGNEASTNMSIQRGRASPFSRA
jgi:hypothetical protein